MVGRPLAAGVKPFYKRHIFSFPLAMEQARKQSLGGLRMNYRINIDLANKGSRAGPV